ncbi:MAG: hypothetical protein ACQETI_06720 [Halobacteriota archaeon]
MDSTRFVAALVALLALVPVALFLLRRPAPVVALSLVSVVIIAGSVYYMLSPAEAEHHTEPNEG